MEANLNSGHYFENAVKEKKKKGRTNNDGSHLHQLYPEAAAKGRESGRVAEWLRRRTLGSHDRGFDSRCRRTNKMMIQ